MGVFGPVERYQAFDLYDIKNRWPIATNGADTMTVAGQPHTTWGTALITLYRSHDGVTPDVLEDPQTLVGTGAAGVMSRTIDCSTVPFVIAVLTTPGTSNTYANLSASRGKA